MCTHTGGLYCGRHASAAMLPDLPGAQAAGWQRPGKPLLRAPAGRLLCPPPSSRAALPRAVFTRATPYRLVFPLFAVPRATPSTRPSSPPPPPGCRLFLPVAPPLSEDDRRVVDNVAKIANFLAGGSAARALGLAGGVPDARAAAELAPLLPEVATQVVPELSRRLAGRITARLIRELFV